MKTLKVTLAAISVLSTTFAATSVNAAHEQSCQALFADADRNGDGSIGVNENAHRYYEMITGSSTSDRGPTDGHLLGKEFFLRACANGSFDRLQSY